MLRSLPCQGVALVLGLFLLFIKTCLCTPISANDGTLYKRAIAVNGSIDRLIKATVKCTVNLNRQTSFYTFSCPYASNSFLKPPMRGAVNFTGQIEVEQAKYIRLRLGADVSTKASVLFAVRFLVQDILFKGSANQVVLNEPSPNTWFTLLYMNNKHRGMLPLFYYLYFFLLSKNKLDPSVPFFDWLGSDNTGSRFKLTNRFTNKTVGTFSKDHLVNRFLMQMLSTRERQQQYSVVFKTGHYATDLKYDARHVPKIYEIDPSYVANYDFDNPNNADMNMDFGNTTMFFKQLRANPKKLTRLFRASNSSIPYDNVADPTLKTIYDYMFASDTFIYVMDSNLKLYVAKPSMGQFSHISFLSARNVVCAGHIRFNSGNITYIDNFSSDYRPSIKDFRVMLQILKNSHVSFSNTKIAEVASEAMSYPLKISNIVY